MSVMNFGSRSGSGNWNGTGDGSEHVEPTPPPYPPRPVAVAKPDPETAQQVQLGNVTLQAVDRMTGMTADEIERAAEQVLEGAQETEAVLRQLAWCVRENGVYASERLASFVRVANQCAEVARSLQECVERREEDPPPEPKKAEPAVEREIIAVAEVDDAPASAPIEQQIEKQVKAVPSRPSRQTAAGGVVRAARPAARRPLPRGGKSGGGHALSTA